MPLTTMPDLKGAIQVCMFCSEPGMDCKCAPHPCYVCGFVTCHCSPSPCCGMLWAPLDWQYRDECGWCGNGITRAYNPLTKDVLVTVTLEGTEQGSVTVVMPSGD